MDVVPVHVRSCRLYGSSGRDGRLLSGLAAGEVIPVAGSRVETQRTRNAGDGHLIHSGVAPQQRLYTLSALGDELYLNRHGVVRGDHDTPVQYEGHRPAAAQNGIGILRTCAHVDYRHRDLVFVPVQPGELLRIRYGTAKIINVAKVCIQIGFKDRRIGGVAGGAQRQAVSPADDAGQVLCHGVHIFVVLRLDDCHRFLSGLGLLLLLLDIHLRQLLVMLHSLLTYPQHHHAQGADDPQDQQRQEYIEQYDFPTITFPHIDNSVFISFSFPSQLQNTAFTQAHRESSST